MRDLELVTLDVCLPDYFKGYTNEVLAVPVFKGMTVGDMIESLQGELDIIELNKDFSGYNHVEADAALSRFKEQAKEYETLNEPAFPGVGTSEDDESIDLVYAYVSFREA